MWQAESIENLRQSLGEWRRAGERIAFVPTMGNLHDGHLSLIERAHQVADRVVVSIFVNPMQFNDADDLARYPRTLDADCEKLRAASVDGLFLPSSALLYPNGDTQITRVSVPGLSDVLEGEHRPGHFTGVTTVVCKLFNCVQPDVAVFGQKDFQQLMLIRHMVADLNMPVAIEAVPTYRAASGLALSSRNGLLADVNQEKSAKIYQVLKKCAEMIQSDCRLSEVEGFGTKQLNAAGFEVEYLVVRRSRDLAPPSLDDKQVVILTAARIDGVRLIDNVELERP
ncbi:pantoate--beta-alanine ligase [gamma proteobacterium HTCC5015]|nr:pantoate--beta-alanine ligase [gamma proteobacterium HTCC5015]